MEQCILARKRTRSCASVIGGLAPAPRIHVIRLSAQVVASFQGSKVIFPSPRQLQSSHLPPTIILVLFVYRLGALCVPLRGIRLPHRCTMADEAGDQETEPFSVTPRSSPIITLPSPSSSWETPDFDTEVIPGSICRGCFDLGNEIWDHDYGERHGLVPERPHYIPAEEVTVAAQKGCLGCEIIAWALEPYMEQIQNCEGEVSVHLRSFANVLPTDLVYRSRSRWTSEFRRALVIRRTPPELVENPPARSNGRWCHLDAVAGLQLQPY